MSRIRLTEQGTPATPPTGRYTFFVDTADGKLKKIDDTGTVTDLEAASTAVNPGDNVSVLTNDAGYITADDQNSDEVPNNSTVSGTTVSDALETLDTDKLDVSEIANPTNANKRFSIKVNAAGDDFELWEEFTAFAKREDPLVHQSNATYEPYLVFTVNIPVTGNYVLRTSYRWSINTTTSNFEAHIEYNGDFLLPLHLEPQDSGGAGTVENNSTGGTTNTGTDQFAPDGGQVVFENLAAGTHTFTLEFRGQANNQEATIYRADMTMERID